MGGGKAPSIPGPDPSQVAYNNYMLEHQKNLDTQAEAAAAEEKANLEAVKSTGLSGYNSYKQNISNQFGAGLLDSTQATQQLKDYEDRYKLGTGYTQADINSFVDQATQGAAGKSATLAGQTYKDILGRSATDSELSSFADLQKTGQYKLTDLVNSIKSGSEYQNKFNDNYLSSYYDTMYGKQGTTINEKGETVKTGTRTFNYNSALDPTFSGDIAKSTGISTSAVPTSFTGTAAEIEEFQQAQRQKRDFMYNAGLTNLQGQIDKDTQKIKNEGTKDVTRIAAQGQLLSNLTSGFWS
jgi:hypothetical protein